VGFKCLPQEYGSQSIFVNSFYTSQADRVLPVRCNMLMTWRFPRLTSACASLNEFLRDIELLISESNSVLFSR
jgi:hypothetical protein